MKIIKPGQFYVHDRKYVRAKKRTNGCEGCVLNSPFLCPNISLKNSKKELPNCELNGIIFVKI